jgi:DNA invertase Pin-like site-specific DNA recombinase
MPAARRRQRPAGTPERWLLYCRQSDTDGDGRDSLSLGSQEDALRSAAAERGAVVVAAIRDADLKGYQDETQRPALAEALQRADAGDYDVLAVWDLSRLARRLSLQERIVDRLDAAGIRLHSHREPHASTPLFRQVVGAFAEELTRIISGNVLRAVRERIRAGQWHGPVPYGYRLDDAHRLAIDDDLAPWVVAIHEHYRDGWAIMEIVRWLIAQDAPIHPVAGPRRHDVAGWNWRRVHRLLTNPISGGFRLVDGVLIPDAHPAIIPPALFALTQERNGRETAPGQRRARYGRQSAVESFLRGGRLYCGCGRAMGANGRQARQAERFMCRGLRCIGTGYRSCGQTPSSIGLAVAERIVRDRLAADLATIRTWREIGPAIRRTVAADQPDTARERRDLERRRLTLSDRLTRARELYVSGRVDLAALDAMLVPLNDQATTLAATIARLPDPVTAVDELRDLAVLASEWRDQIPRADIPTMTMILERLEVVAHLDATSPDRIRLAYGTGLTALLSASQVI